jgi:hypothetical protein
MTTNGRYCIFNKIIKLDLYLPTHKLSKNTNIEKTINSIAIVFFLPRISIIIIVIKRPGNSARVV